MSKRPRVHGPFHLPWVEAQQRKKNAVLVKYAAIRDVNNFSSWIADFLRIERAVTCARVG